MKKLIFLMMIGVSVASFARAQTQKAPPKGVIRQDPNDPKKKIVYQEGQTLDFTGLSLEGELNTPGEFYFQNRNQERFDSLTKRRLNFHREMLRDSIQSQ